MEVRRLKDFADIGQEQWNALCTRSGTSTIFQTYEWHVAWWEAYGGGAELYLLSVYDGDDLVGIAPMMIQSELRGRRTLAFVGHFRSDYLDFICDAARPGVLDAIVADIASMRDAWDRIELVEIPQPSPTHREIARAAGENGLYCSILWTRACPALVIKDNRTEVARITNKKKLRYYKRYFEERPGYSVRHLSGCEEIGRHLDGFFEQHIARWAGTPTPSIFLEDASRNFYRNLLGSMCDNGWITFTVLESVGQPIAYHFGFIYSDVFVLYKPVYDPLLARRSPGQVLLKELMDFAVAQGCDEFDFTVGAEAYKQRFATETRYNTTYAIVKRKGQLRALQLRTGIKRLLEGNPLGARLLGLRKRLVSRMIPRLKETLHRYGFAGWTLRAAGILFQRFIYRYNKILFLEMAGGLAPERVIEPRIKGVVFHEGTLEDLVRFEYPESPVLKQDFLAAWKKDLAKGDKCFVAEIEGEVAATVWIRFQDYAYISEADTHITFEDKPLYIYDAWTLPEFRGKNLLPFLYSKMLALYPDRRKIVYFHESNVGSLRAALKLGSFRVTRIYYLLSILGIKWRWSKPYTGPQPEL